MILNLNVKKTRPSGTDAFIEVPQATYGMAWGPVRDIRYIFAKAASEISGMNCVALALVEKRAKRGHAPFVFMACIDDHNLAEGKPDPANPSRTRIMINTARQYKENLQAFVAGEAGGFLMQRVTGDLEAEGIDWQKWDESGKRRLVIRLADGKPVSPEIIDNMPRYEAHGWWEMDMKEHLSCDRLYLKQDYFSFCFNPLAMPLQSSIPREYTPLIPAFQLSRGSWLVKRHYSLIGPK